jgi:hypothetical protein
MSILDPLTSTRRPRPGTPVQPTAEVRARLHALNRPSSPFRIVEGQARDCDLAAEWKLTDAEWRPLFARAGIHRVFRVLLRFDPVRHVVRMVEHPYEVTWDGDVPTQRPAPGAFRSAARSIEFSQEIAYSEQRATDEVILYRFETREMKEPIGDVVTGCGWTLKGASFARL